MKIFGIKNCDKIKKTILWCAKNQQLCEFHDYRVDGLDNELLSHFLQQFTLEELVNKRSTTWRQLTDQQKEALSHDSVLENPTLLKRPIIEIKGKLHVGYFPEKWS